MLLSGITGSTEIDSSSKSGEAQNRLQEDLNRFLNLLVTQLKNQDPLDPLDANEFTSQLVQFASVEQQIYANANMEKLVNLQQQSQTSFMIDYIGKTVETLGDKVNLEDGKAEFNYLLDTNAVSVQVSVQNSAGQTVFTTEGETTAGKHNIVWDGKNQQGVQMADGVYTIVVAAMDRDGKLLEVEQTVVGRVVGAGNDNGEPTLFVGEILTPMDQVLTVRETPPQQETVN
jgi:flagellar basal-body rod modification protein FlgD